MNEHTNSTNGMKYYIQHQIGYSITPLDSVILDIEVPLVKYYNGTSVVIITIRQTITKEAHLIKAFQAHHNVDP